MDGASAPYEMVFQEVIPPLPNAAPAAADWLPAFVGSSWLAYGAQHHLVICTAPSTTDTEEAAAGRFFQQIVELSNREREWVKTVSWSPQVPSLGILAAAAGNNIFLLGPKARSRRQKSRPSFPGIAANGAMSGLPLAWEGLEVLRHAFQVFAFAWTFSGDGLLAAGSEIIMWQEDKGDGTWSCLWRVPAQQPQHLCAAGLFAKGMVATANGCEEGTLTDGIGREDTRQLSSKDRATIWCWEDGLELEEVELLHPQKVLMVQWRPSKVAFGSTQSGDSGQPQRQILLTSSRDGALRLWIEIDSGKSRNDRAAGKESSDKRSKTTFFVSAVIEVNRNLQGQLGQNIHVTWATDVMVRAFGGAGSTKNSAISQDLKGNEVATCEWLVGLGPNGSISLWSLHCLDDVSPPRCPRALLWNHGSDLLPDQLNPSFVKAVVQRHEGTLAEPPSSLDVFEILQGGHYRCLRIWPPVAAIGGGGSKAGQVNSGTSSAPGRKSAWSVAGEDMLADGHDVEVLSIAVHPIITTKLAASLDKAGNVLLWLLSSVYQPQFDIENFSAPLVRLSGRLTKQQISGVGHLDVLAWAPIVLPGGETVLLVANAEGVSCFLIFKESSSPKGKPEIVKVCHRHMCTLTWPLLDGHGAEGVYTVPSRNPCVSTDTESDCVILGVGNSGTALVAWKLLINLTDRNFDDQADKEKYRMGLEETQRCIQLETLNVKSGLPNVLLFQWHILGSTALANEERVTSVDAVRRPCSVSDPAEGRHCEMITGCADGIIRTWRIDLCGDTSEGGPEQSFWRSLGLLKAGDTEISAVAVTHVSGLLASVSAGPAQDGHSVCIWQAMSILGHGQYSLEDRIQLLGPISALSWSEQGNGLALLAIALPNEVQVHVQSKTRGGDCARWRCLAVVPLFGRTDTIAWGPYASLFVASGGHICVMSLRTSGRVAFKTGDKKLQKLSAAFPNSVSSPSLSMYSASNAKGRLEERIPYSLSYNALPREPYVSSEKLPVISVQDRSGTLMEAVQFEGSPLLDYHPKKILWFLNRGEKGCARASIRHLVHYLVASTLPTDVDGSPASASDTKPVCQPIKVPVLSLMEFLPDEDDVAAADSTGFNPRARGRLSTFKLNLDNQYSFLDTDKILDSLEHNEERTAYGDVNQIRRGGREPLSKPEVEGIVRVLEQHTELPGLLGCEKIQLLALVDTLVEMDGVSTTTQSLQLDQPGQRFWLAARYVHHQSLRRKAHNLTESDLNVDSKAMAWALQSESKDDVLDFCLSEQPLWTDFRALGMGFWYSDHLLLRKRMEKLARAQYLTRKDPKDCMLLYLALDRKNVLTGLFKLSRDDKDKNLYEFLTRDFKDDKHKGAALKNAYVLMGKHRHELAASFFLLGGDVASCVGICSKNLVDPQLALIICRLVEGSNGPIGTNLVAKQLIPAARLSCDFWLASLLQWLIGQKLEAMRELTRLQKVETGPFEYSSYAQDEEAGIFFPTGSCNSRLDPDVVELSTILLSKSRLQAGPFACEASRILRDARSLTVYSLSRTGFPLQALEQLASASTGSLSKLRRLSSLGNRENWGSRGDEAAADESLAVPNKVKEGNVGCGWMSDILVADVAQAMKDNLALQCASQLLQDHPGWLTGIWTWKQLAMYLDLLIKSGGLGATSCGFREAGQELDSHEEFSRFHQLLKKADDLLFENLKAMEKKFSVNVHRILRELFVLSSNFGRPYFVCHLKCTLQGVLADSEKECLTRQSNFPVMAQCCMKAVCKDVPWVLARAVLACGGAVAPGQKAFGQVTGGGEGEWRQSVARLVQETQPGVTSLEGGALPWPQLESMIRYALEILLLASAASPATLKAESSASCEGSATGIDKRTKDVASMLAYVLSVAAAWLGRRANALLMLVGPILKDPATPPTIPLVQLDASAWLLNVDQQERGLQSKVADGVGKDGGGSVNKPSPISEDDVWRVLGFCLWSHVLSYARRQLSGCIKEGSYSSFGRVSQIQSPSRTSPKSPFGGLSPARSPPLSPSFKKASGILGSGFHPSSPTSDGQASGASFVKVTGHSHDPFLSDEGHKGTDGLKTTSDLLQDSASDSEDPGMPLMSCLACIAAGLRRQLASHVFHCSRSPTVDPLLVWLWGKPTQSASSDSSAILSSPQDSLPLQEVAQEVACVELWKLLVVKEKVLSALGLEGIIGPRATVDNEGMTNVSQRRGSGPPGPGSGGAAGTSARGSTSFVRDSNASGRPLSGKMTGDTNNAIGRGSKGAVEGLVGNVRGTSGRGFLAFQPPEEVLHLSGELFEAICVNSCNPEQLAVASHHKGILFLDLKTHGSFSKSTDNLWSEADWPKDGWAGSVSTPTPIFEATTIGLGTKVGARLGVGGSAASRGLVARPGKDFGRGVGFGVPGYGGMGAWGWGGEEWEEGVVDPPATVQNVHTKAMAAHPLRPLFLVGSDNTHVYLWEFGKGSATATYGVLPGTNVPPLYVIPSVSAVRFDHCGHRFATAALDGSVSIWQLEVGGRSNVCPTDSRMCFGRLASDVAFVGPSGSILATTGSTQNGENLVIWDTLAPPNASRSVVCHEGGARCIGMFDNGVEGSSSVPLIVTGGKTGDISVHDFRYIAGGKSKRHRASARDALNSPTAQRGSKAGKLGDSTGRKQGQRGTAGMIWHLPHAHSGGISRVVPVPGTSLFFSASKDGDVKLWDVNTSEMVEHWHKVHERHLFMRHDSTGFGAIHGQVSQLESLLYSLKNEAAVTDLQVLAGGFLTSGSDGIVKLFREDRTHTVNGA